MSEQQQQQRNDPMKEYVTPSLRAAAFWRLFPTAHVEFHTVPFNEAFPAGTKNPTEASEAVVCTIIFEGGSFVEAAREIDRKEEKWEGPREARRKAMKDRELDSNAVTVDRTKAFGRAMTLAGIPQRQDAFQTLLRWVIALEGGKPAPVNNVGPTTITHNIMPGTDKATEQIAARPPAEAPPAPADAPPGVEPATGEIVEQRLQAANTPEAVQQRLEETFPGAVAETAADGDSDDDPVKKAIKRFSVTSARFKPQIAKAAKERHDIGNCLKITTPEQAAQLTAIMDELVGPTFTDADMAPAT